MSELNEKKKKRKKAGTESSKESSLRDWFKRKGAKGSKGGWVDCNAPDGKGGYKSCGRSSGEKRKRYPACRPTPSACKERGRGKSWGKKGSKKKKNESLKLTAEEIRKIIVEELETVLHESAIEMIDELERLWLNEENWEQVYLLVTSLQDPDIDKWYQSKLDELEQQLADSSKELIRLKKEKRKIAVKHQRAIEQSRKSKTYDPYAPKGRRYSQDLKAAEGQVADAERAVASARRKINTARSLPVSGAQIMQEEMRNVIYESQFIPALERLFNDNQKDQVEHFMDSLNDPEVYAWYIGKLREELEAEYLRYLKTPDLIGDPNVDFWYESNKEYIDELEKKFASRTMGE